jgi:dTDP-4-dehydrorhamnose 3,5-epimerase
VFELRGRSATDVTAVTTEQYAEGKDLAPRPRHSTLDLTKVVSTGFVPRDGSEAVEAYLKALGEA